MAAEHEIFLVISNSTAVRMKYVSSQFDSGRLAETEQWPSQIDPDGHPYKTVCVDKNHAVAGVSGSVTYSFHGVQVTIGFSNPVLGSNKFSVVTKGHSAAMAALDDYGYNSHSVDITIDEFVQIRAIGSTTKGDVNRINLAFQSSKVW